ncbi:MAG TPA: methyltransferase domain-containing protein [Steroidobacteraceae bacterium]|nr:methyltransferase domain-containing protein [Steroidobacteraceae bacterium]
MNLVIRLFQDFSARARRKRAVLFREAFALRPDTKILDLGSESGTNIHAVLSGTPVLPQNTYIADISAAAVERGAKNFGYQPVLVGENGKLPFPDGYFDIVYCSSVIEHVTLPKSEIWTTRSGREFRERSLQHQRAFAREIQRVGRQFFVQTPYRWFVLESHSWLPFLSWLPRRMIIPILKASRGMWPKWTTPDWYLLTRRELAGMFDGAKIRDEKWLGMTKSIMAVKSDVAPVRDVRTESAPLGAPALRG